MSTLGEIKQRGYALYLFCEGRLGDGWCAHSTKPSIDQLIQYMGVDFDVGARRQEFLARFVCEVCGCREATLRVLPISAPGHMVGTGRAHDHQPSLTPEQIEENRVRFESEWRKLGVRSNAEEAAYWREQRRKRKNRAKAGADFIGPPNPWAHRKKGRWL